MRVNYSQIINCTYEYDSWRREKDSLTVFLFYLGEHIQDSVLEEHV